MTYSRGQAARSSVFSRSISKYSLGVSGLALMVGLMASTGAQAQCTGTEVTTTYNGKQQNALFSSLFPFGQGGGINALTSVISTANTAFLTSTTAFVSAPGDAAPDQQGGGIWIRGIAGSVDTKANSSFNGSVYYTGINPSNQPVSGSSNCATKVDQDFHGFQAGHDIATLNDSVFGANWHFGVTAGYMESKFHDATQGGTLAGDFQVPFAGVYAAFSRGNLLADFQARADYYQGELNDPAANAIVNQRVDARGYSLTGNIGYRVDVPNTSWFVEPSVGGVYSHVSVDPINVTGTWLASSQWPGTLPGRVQIGDVDSELGRASVRVGTTFTSGNIIAQPFFAASVYHEFAGDVTSTLSQGPFKSSIPGYNLAANISTSRVGTYEQFGVGSAFQLANTGWLGYARVDWRTGDYLEGFTANLGVRYQLNRDVGLESLKDSPVSFKDGPSYVGHDWSGIYLGDTVGATRGSERWAFTTTPVVTEPDFAGYLISSQIGYNYQVGHVVAGVEGDYGFSNARGAISCGDPAFSCEANLDEFGSVTGRLGYAWGRTLLYAKGGLAFGDVSANGHWNAGTPNLLHLKLVTPYSADHWETGWTVGAGMEFALTDKWSAKAEYMHYDLGSEHYVLSAVDQANINTYGDIVRVGLNYHLDLAHLGLDPVPFK